MKSFLIILLCCLTASMVWAQTSVVEFNQLQLPKKRTSVMNPSMIREEIDPPKLLITNFTGLDSTQIKLLIISQKRYKETFDEQLKVYKALSSRFETLSKKYQNDSSVKSDVKADTTLRKKIQLAKKYLDTLEVNVRDSLSQKLGDKTAIVNFKDMEKIRNKGINSAKQLATLLDEVQEVLDTDFKKGTSALETLPTLIASSAFFSPTVNLLGSFTNRDKGRSFTIQVFKGGNNKDSSLYDNFRRLLEPNASAFGISFSYLQSLDFLTYKTQKTGAFYIKNHFLFKDIPNVISPSKEKTTLNSAFFQSNFGIELAPLSTISDKFSVYGGGNVIWNLNQTENFQKYFSGTSANAVLYYNLGFKASIPLSDDEKNLLTLDLNNLFINDSLKKLYQTKDSMVPIISIGLKRNIVSK